MGVKIISVGVVKAWGGGGHYTWDWKTVKLKTERGEEKIYGPPPPWFKLNSVTGKLTSRDHNPGDDDFGVKVQDHTHSRQPGHEGKTQEFIRVFTPAVNEP